ncbi:MAG: hypothetical protein ACEPOW_14130 [Bacteroidales bacterium]
MKRFIVVYLILVLGTFSFAQGTGTKKSSKKETGLKEFLAHADKVYDESKEIVKEKIGKLVDYSRVKANEKGLNPDAVTAGVLLRVRDISPKVKEDILIKRSNIKKSIFLTAKFLETQRNDLIDLDHDIIGLNQYSRKKLEKYNNAVTLNNVSLTKLKIAIRHFVNVSKDVYKQAVIEKDTRKKRELYLDYNAFVYELSTILIDVLSNFAPEGIVEIRQMYQQHKITVDEVMDDLERSKKEAQKFIKPGGEKNKYYEAEIKKIEAEINSKDAFFAVWGKILNTIENQEDWLEKMQDELAHFKWLRDRAASQLKYIAINIEVGHLAELINNADELTKIANEVKILPFDSETLRIIADDQSFTLRANREGVR